MGNYQVKSIFDLINPHGDQILEYKKYYLDQLKTIYADRYVLEISKPSLDWLTTILIRDWQSNLIDKKFLQENFLCFLFFLGEVATTEIDVEWYKEYTPILNNWKQLTLEFGLKDKMSNKFSDFVVMLYKMLIEEVECCLPYLMPAYGNLLLNYQEFNDSQYPYLLVNSSK